MADTDKKYIPEGVFLVCDQGGDPTQLICDPHPINLYGVRYADENDNKPHLNITSFGTCKTMGRCQPPLLLEWTKLKEDVRLHGARPLLEDSECLCQIGSGVIKIFFDGHAAAQAAEDNNESSFVKDAISSNVLGMLTSGPLGLISPSFREGVGRGLKKGLEGTWNFITHDAWQGETWVGMGKMAVIAVAYGTPGGAFTADATLGSLDSMFGTDFRQTRDAIAGGVERAVGNSVENVRRGNWSEVGEDVGQIQYAVIEAVVGSKGAGLALKGARTAGTLAVGAQRLAQITAQAQRALQVLRNGVRGIVKVASRIEIEPGTLGTTGGNIRLRPINEIPQARRNARLAGSTHPRTGVPFDSKGYPVFNSVHDVNIPDELIGPDISDARQFRNATEDLRTKLERNPSLRNNFSEAQLQQISRGEPYIDGYTWHHHQDGVRLQLVDRETHRLTGHDGGRRNTGGR